jgi:predicted dehydrogenase
VSDIGSTTRLSAPATAVSTLSRRRFLRTTLLTAAAGLASTRWNSAWAAPLGSNDAVRVAIIGLNTKGTAHLKHLLEIPGVRVAALCDVDPLILRRATELLSSRQLTAFTTTDARAVMDRKDVDAVVIATSNHWHALLTVWACHARKDVYVEKPMSRTVWEGRQMIEAATRHQRILQVGMQYHSETGLAAALRYVQSGQLGRIQHIRAVIYLKRDSIGRRAAWYPDHLDYDRFCGPTPVVPLERNQLHYDWHWMWATGNGDLGNNGVHVLGAALRFAGHTTIAPRIASLGGRYAVDDVAETPNTMLTLYDYPEIPIVYEQRGLPAKPGVTYMDQHHGQRAGIVVTCEGGIIAGLTGAVALDSNGNTLEKFAGDGGASHMQNFLTTVRTRRSADLAAPGEAGHLAAATCHYGNISYRLGDPKHPAEAQSVLGAAAPAREALGELEQHMGVHGIDLAHQPWTVGPSIHPDKSGDDVARVSSGTASDLAAARSLLRETQRPPYLFG